MSNIGKHMKEINDLNLDTYNYHYIDVQNKIDSLSAEEGKRFELGMYVNEASKNSKQFGERIKNLLKSEGNTDTSNFSANYFESTYMPCYTGVAGSGLVVPTLGTKHNYVINKKNANASHIDNLVQNTTLDIPKTDQNYGHFYKFEKEFVIYNEQISVGGGGEIKVGKWDAYKSTPWDNSVYTRLNGGSDWHSPPRDGDTVLQHEFHVLKTKPPYKWIMYHSDENDITGENDPSWREDWKDHSRWLKFEYKNIVENKIRAWFIIENTRQVDGIENLNYELNGLFDGKTYRCKKISMPISGGCSGQMNVSDTDYYFLQNKHKDLFNMCNTCLDEESIETIIKANLASGKLDVNTAPQAREHLRSNVCSRGNFKPFKSGFQNEYTKVKKQLGSGYIFASGMLMLYLIHRLFNRK